VKTRTKKLCDVTASRWTHRSIVRISSVFAAIIVLFSPLRCVFAQEAPLQASALRTSVTFGSPVFITGGMDAFSTSAGTRYMDRGATLSISGPNVRTDGEGLVLFVQRESRFTGDMPPAAGNFVALAHKDGFVSVFSGKQFIPDSSGKIKVGRDENVGTVYGAPGTEAVSYILHVYDGAGRVWVNPAFFIPGLEDRIAPKIEQFVLIDKNKAEFSLGGEKKGATQHIAQGNYSLAIRVFDPENKAISTSGVFGFKAILDGKIILERKLDSARSTNNGLAFLGMEAPSSSLIDSKGRIVLSDYFVPRGTHTLEFLVMDFAGNIANLSWKFAAD
jgi:hypothetical protein